jgi:hypothetical protein
MLITSKCRNDAHCLGRGPVVLLPNIIVLRFINCIFHRPVYVVTLATDDDDRS